MQDTHRLLHALPHSVSFVDYQGVRWNEVRRTTYWMYQRFRYQYPGPVSNMHQRLMVVPPSSHGDQYLSGHKLEVVAANYSIKTSQDDFGNFIYYLDLPCVEQTVDFEVWSSIERNATLPHRWPHIPTTELDLYLAPTTLTNPDDSLDEVAASLRAENIADSWQLADRINDWVWQRMIYQGGVTNVATTAAQALALGKGLCQDYSHIMITLCRLLGLPARYVSGQLLGEGGSHAWVEVILPATDGRGYWAVPFDPTNHCRAGLRHVTVAVGRDYRDVSPTSGYFTAPYQGQLTSSKRVGLLTVEYADGTYTEVDDSDFIFRDDHKRIA